ncbi:hypothetical protein L798_15753 [Zootermopsis nevadensis]|uniref:Uncharacterized protein n=1 Tax=Zootermopsis nevadensis TaxID=136037 RepID=A0A067QMG7_ZOONE|nr:hypothetical protein L798_15753 [Zootermopsis nevadensis]
MSEILAVPINSVMTLWCYKPQDAAFEFCVNCRLTNTSCNKTGSLEFSITAYFFCGMELQLAAGVRNPTKQLFYLY